MKAEGEARAKMVIPSPPPPPLPRFWVRATDSVTNRQIANFWRQRRIDEEEHLFAAIKAAARIRARNFTEEDYRRFKESIDNDADTTKEEDTKTSNNIQDTTKQVLSNCEVRVGIKDWWTKSKYAYLNEPAVESMGGPKKAASTYVPNCISYNPTPFYPTSVF